MFTRPVLMALLTTVAPFLSGSVGAEVPVRSGIPSAQTMASACSLDCDRKASECVDGCEERYPDEDKARVECKVTCIEARRRCEANCK